MLDGSTLIPTGRLACTCPLCGAALAVAPIRSGLLQDEFQRQNLAQQLVLEHLTQAHASVLEYSSVLAIGRLVAAGGRSCETALSTN